MVSHEAETVNDVLKGEKKHHKSRYKISLVYQKVTLHCLSQLFVYMAKVKLRRYILIATIYMSSSYLSSLPLLLHVSGY